MHHLLFLVICAVWSSSFLAMKWAEPAFGTIGTGWVRFLGGAAVLAIIWRLWPRPWPFAWKDCWPLLLVGAVGNGWPFVIQPWLVIEYGSGFIGMMVGFVPLVTVLAQIPMLGRYPSPRELIGVLGGLVCLVLLFADGLDRAVPWTGLVLAASVPVAYAVSNTFVRRCYPNQSPLELTLAALVIAAIAIGPLLAFEERTWSGPVWQLALAFVILGPLATGLCLYGFYHLVQTRGPLFAGMVTYVIPVGAVGIGWLDGEPVSALQMMVLAGTIICVVLVQTGRPPAPKKGGSDGGD